MKEDAKILVNRLGEISELIDLHNFYSINLSPQTSQISLQGKFNDTTIRFAKEVNVELIYESSNGMLKGESENGKLRIVLTT